MARKRVGRKPRLGSGGRYAAIEKSAKARGVRSPGGVAYSAGVKKYGKAKMAKLAAAGRRRAARGRKRK